MKLNILLHRATITHFPERVCDCCFERPGCWALWFWRKGVLALYLVSNHLNYTVRHEASKVQCLACSYFISMQTLAVILFFLMISLLQLHIHSHKLKADRIERRNALGQLLKPVCSQDSSRALLGLPCSVQLHSNSLIQVSVPL